MNQTWFITEDAGAVRQEELSALTQKYGSLQLAALAMSKDSDEDYDGYPWPNPVGYQAVSGVAVISVEGHTEAKTSFISRAFGSATYEDIKYRLMEAYEDSEVSSVLLNLDTPGGQAKGAFGLANFIAQYNEKIKPIVSFSEGQVASAGILYGTAGSGLLLDEHAEAGSIGAVAVFSERTQLMKSYGVSVKVFRSAPYKAVPNSLEKLDDKGEEVMKEIITSAHNKFVGTLVNNLGLSVETIQQTMANGKMFSAPKAVSMGLSQGLTTFEKLVATMASKYQNNSTLAGRPIQTTR